MTEPRKASLIESMALGGTAASFAVNFTHPIVSKETNTGTCYNQYVQVCSD